MGIAMLVEAFRVTEQDLTPVRIKIYERAMTKWPEAIIEPAIMRTIETRTSKARGWLPSIEELNQDAEAVRLEMRAAIRFEPCAMCSQQGWTETEIDGVRRMVRCACWTRHQARLAALNVGAQPLALPAAESSDFSRIGESE